MNGVRNGDKGGRANGGGNGRSGIFASASARGENGARVDERCVSGDGMSGLEGTW